MFHKLLLLLQIAFIVIISSDAKLTLECLVDFLKFRNVADDAFNSVDSFTGNPGDCSADVKAKITGLYSSQRAKLEANIRQKPYADCVMKEIEVEAYENLLLKATAIDLKGVGLKFWKVSKKNSRIKDLEEKAQDLVNEAVVKCKGQIDFGAFFDSFYEQKRNEQITDELDHCMRKYLVDKNAINPNLYNFKVNPKNLKTNDIQCDHIMTTVLEQLKEQAKTGGTTICVLEKFLKQNYLEKILKIQVLARLNLTPIEKQSEKQVFITQMVQMTHSIFSCTT